MMRLGLAILGLVWKPLAIGLAALAAYAWLHHTIVSAERARAEARELRAVVAEQQRQARATAGVLERARAAALERLAENEAMREKVNALPTDKDGRWTLGPDLRRELHAIR